MRADRRHSGAVLRVLLVGAISLAGSGSRAQNGVPGAASSVAGSAAGGARVGFRFENPGLQPARYSLVIAENGSGQFHSEPSNPPLPDTASYQPLAEPLDRPVQLSRPVVEQIFSTARAEKFFAMACEDGKNKIAYQGTKELSYHGPDGRGACTFNWSKSAAIERLTSTFESIAFTLEEGRRLAVEHKHDRLGLDAELASLEDAVKDGRALEIETIEAVLQEIIADEAVLERARARARKLLEAGSSTASLR